MIKNLTLFLLLSLTTAFAISVPPLVTPEWVYNNPDKAEMVILDLQDAKTYQLHHIPGAVNVSYDWLTVNGSATFQSLDNIKKIYAANNLSLTGAQINYCHTGHRASLAWFVSHELLGNKEALLYDGSTSEWAIDHSLPMDDMIKLKH